MPFTVTAIMSLTKLVTAECFACVVPLNYLNIKGVGIYR